MTVNTDYSTSSLTNSATLAATDPGGNPVTKTASSTIAVNIPAPATAAAFTLTKTSSAAQVAPGGSVTWTIAYKNYGGTTATGVTITDTLPSGFTFSSCTGSCSGSPGTWSIGSVAAGASGSVTVTATAANPFTATNPATNSASINWTGNTGSAVTATNEVGITGNACSTYYFRKTTASVGFDGTQQLATVSPVPQASDVGGSTTITVPGGANTYSATVLSLYQDPASISETAMTGDLTTQIYLDRNPGPGITIRATVYDYNSTTGARSQLGQSTTSFTGSQTGLLAFTLPLSGTLSKDHRILWTYEATSNNSQSTTLLFQYDGTVTNSISGNTPATFANSNAAFCVTPPANLTLSKTVDKASVTGGTSTSVQYTLTFANTGQTKATGAQVVDTLPTDVSVNTATCCTLNGASVTPSQSGQQLTFSNVKSSTDATAGEISGGASGTIVINATVGSSASGTLTNTASISSTQTSAVTATATTTVTSGGGGGSPALSISKSANKTLVNAGEIVTNTGSAAASSAIVTDPIPSGATYQGNITASAGSGSFDTVNNRVVFNVGTLAAGAAATLTFKVSIANLPAGPTTITNTVTASAADASSRSASTDVSASATSALTLTKSAPAQVAYPAATLTQAANGTTLFVNDTTQLTVGQYVSVGGSAVLVSAITGNTITVGAPVSAASGTSVIGGVTYALTYQNTGTATATSVTLTDTLPAGVTFVAASNGGTLAGGTVTWNLGDLDPGTGGSVQVTVIPGGTGTLVNNASITCGACSATPASATTTAGGLRVTKRTTTPTAAAGGTATYIIDVENTSGSTISSVTVTDTLASGFSYASTTSIVNGGVATSATTSPTAGDTVLSWGTFAIQAGKVLTVTFVANIAASTGAATYQNAAGATPLGSTVAFDPLSTTAEDVTVLASSTGLVQGYVFQDNNNNGVFEPAIDTPLTGARITITGGPYTAASDPSGYFSRVVPTGQKTVEITSADIPSGLVLGSTFINPETVTVPDGGSATKDTGYIPLSASPDLTIAKAHVGNFTQGQTGATYTLTVTNAGSGPTSGTVTVSDTLPTGLTATGIAGTGWTCVLGTLTCTRTDSLGAGLSYPVITLTVNVANDAPSGVTNVATVSGGGQVNTGNDTASDPTTVDAPPSPPVPTIPTLSEWGMILFALLLALEMAHSLRTRINH